MIQTQPFDISDFSGGITDKFVDAPASMYQRCDNLQVTVNRKLLSRPGSEIYDAAHPQVGAQATRVGSLIGYDADSGLLAQQVKDLYQYKATGWTKLAGPTGASVFASGDVTSAIASAQGQKHLILANDAYSPIVKVYRDDTNTLQVRTAGLPTPASAPTIAGVAGTKRYLYAFHYQYSYKVESTEFLDLGPVYECPVVLTEEPTAGPPAVQTSITGIPLLANAGGSHYDTANIKVSLYRTINSGSVFYKLAELAPGVTSYTDTTKDDDLINGEPLYTTGNVLDNDPPPAAKYVHIAGAYCYYANVKEGTQIIPTRVRQSVASDYDSVPLDNWVDVNTEITGISSVRGVPIVLTKKGIYRIDGAFDELGGGGMIAQIIDDTVDCVAHQSIVQVLDGVVWCASDGVYFSDGYKITKITTELSTTYNECVTTPTLCKRIIGAYDPIEHRVYWSVRRGPSGTENDSLLVLDLRWGIRPQSTFTTWSGGESFKPSSLLVYQRKLLRGDSRGYVLQHDADVYSDPLINTALPVSQWGRSAIIYDWVSAALSFGTNQVRKWVSKVNVAIDTVTNVSARIYSINDTLKKVKPLAEIRFRGRFTWGEYDVVWGDPSLVWNFQGAIQEVRRMPAGSLRLSYKQVQLTNAFTNIVGSDLLGEAIINPITKTAVLLGAPATVKWPVGAVDYFLTFASDQYSRQYRVTARTDDTLAFEDDADTAPTGQVKWVLKGKPKDEVMNLQSVTLYVAPFSDSITSYQGESGGNSA